MKGSALVWPILEYLVRRRHTPSVAARIQRLNQGGKAEGEATRGWHPHHRSRDWSFDCLTVQGFIKKFGREKYRELPRAAFLGGTGKRKRISRLYVFNHL